MSIALAEEREVDSSVDIPESYRALSAAAVVSCVLGVMSILAFADFWLGVVPLLAIVLGVIAWRSIVKRPDELTGLRLAQVGVALGTVLWAGGASWLTFVYFTEVPEGYERISYSALQPDDTDPPGEIPAWAKAIDGKKVFIKGYIYPPPGSPVFVNEFLLVRDKGDCCFGGNPKVTDRILVNIPPPDKLEFTTGIHSLAGTFRVQPGLSKDAEGEIWYRLEADQAK